MTIKDQIEKDIEEVVGSQFVVNGLRIEVTRTADAKNGDYSTNIAFRLSRLAVSSGPKAKSEKPKTNRSPLEFAKLLADNLENLSYVEKVEVAGPGFVNIFVKDSVWQSEVQKVLSDLDRYGANETGNGKKARVEFVSANPTGPLHFGNARGGPIGDTLARVLEASGYDVLREYIHNDIGGQVRKLGETIANVAAGQKLGDQEYKGEYIKEIVEKIGNFKTPEEAGKLAVDMMLDETLADCEAMGIKFDKVYPESGFVESGDTERAIAELDKKGFIKEKDGAKWFAPSDEFLKDRETVVVKSDGSYTYFSNDISYHKIKFSEGYDLVIDIFGANHHGHVPRLQAVIKALGGDVTKFHVILYQWVRFKKSGEILAMSKRSGNFITAREILEMVGSDAVRFFVLMHDPNSHIDFDLDLAREKSNKNPVFYVQYAHARIASIMAKASLPVILSSAGSGSEGSKTIDSSSVTQNRQSPAVLAGAAGLDKQADCSLLTTEYELNLIKKVVELPELVEDVAKSFAVNRLTTYAMELADTFHKFYENCRVLPRGVNKDEREQEGVTEELTRARLALVEATRIALKNTLNLLGISAPEKM